MIWIKRHLLVLAVAVSVLGLASACGGGSSPTAAGSAGATAGSSGAAAASPSVAASPTGGDVNAFCDLIKQQRDLLLGTDMPDLLASGTPAAWKAYLDKETTLNQQLVDAAPPEIQGAAKTLQTTTLQLKSIMVAAGYDPKRVGSARLIQLLQSPERKTASTQLVAYIKDHCGIDLSKV